MNPTIPTTPRNAVRIGIDVGGTFTKGVALDAVTREVFARARVPTTHRAEEGVVSGVVEVLDALLAELPEGQPVALVAHATTQATNALLEGDMATVGLLALGPASDERLIARRTRLAELRPGGGRRLELRWAFVPSDATDFEARVRGVAERWRAEGVEAVAVSQAFAVDDPSLERRACALVRDAGLPATGGAELTGVYGLEMRSSTAAINASILPIMLRTAGHVERALERRLPDVPLLVVRGDGGAVDLQGLREAPIHTVVSGPAASLAGAILHHGVRDGVLFEVGGTSTNIGAVRAGRPVMKHMTVMDFPTALRAADIRIAGVAGGSLVRLGGRRIEEVGPRSAHIAGLGYASLADPAELADARLVRTAPRPGDPADYAVLEAAGGRFALTPTCAANALELLPDDDPARRPPEAARIAMAALARELNADVEAAARAVLEAAAEKLTDTVRALADAYELRGTPLYGGGGAARVLGPVVARRLGVPFECVPEPDVISSVGAALTLIRVERERNARIDDPTVGDLLLREVEGEAVRLGADPARLQAEVRYLPEERLLRAVAFGAHPVDGHQSELDDEVLLRLARQQLGGTCHLHYRSPVLVLIAGERQQRRLLGRVTRHPVLAMDRRGGRMLELDDAQVTVGAPNEVLLRLDEQLGSGTAPQAYALTPRRLIDCSHLNDPNALRSFLRDLFRLESEVALVLKAS